MRRAMRYPAVLSAATSLFVVAEMRRRLEIKGGAR